MEDDDKVIVEILKSEEIRTFYQAELRSLELTAFGIFLEALRAQGGLTEKRKVVIGAVKQALNISDERHMCELRRVASNIRLAKIAERIAGDSGVLDWNAAGYKDCPLYPQMFQHPLGSRQYPVPPEDVIPEDDPTIQGADQVNYDIEETQMDSDDEKFLLENGWSSDSEAEMVYAQRVDRPDSDTEIRKTSSAKAKAAALASLAIRRKRKKSTPYVSIRKSQTSPDITAGSPSKLRKPLPSPKLVGGHRRKNSNPTKAAAAGRKASNIPAVQCGMDSYASITAMASRLGITPSSVVERTPSPPRPIPEPEQQRSVRGRGGGRSRGSRRGSLTPNRRKPKVVPAVRSSSISSVDLELRVGEEQPNHKPKQRRKSKLVGTELKSELPVCKPRRKKMKGNPRGGDSENVYNGLIPSMQHLGDEVNLHCNESLPNEDSGPASSLANNNSEHFGNYEAESGNYSGQRFTPPTPPVPLKRPRAKSEVPAKMRHKMSSHMFGNEDSNTGVNGQPTYTQQPEPKPFAPLVYTPPTNSLSHFSSNNFYSELQLTPGINPPRPRMTQGSNPSSSYGFGVPSSSHLPRSPIRNTLPTPVFSTTLNANSLHKKRTQILLPSTYQAQTAGLNSFGDVGMDGSVATASSLAAKNRSTLGLYDQHRQSMILNSVVRPITPAPQVQRKAQPHILSSSKLHRPLPISPATVGISPPTTVGSNILQYAPATTSSSPPTPGAIALENYLTAASGSGGNLEATGTTGAEVSVGDGFIPGINSSSSTGVITSVHNIHNFQTSNVSPGPVMGGSGTLGVSNSGVLTSMPSGLGVNMNLVRGQPGSNIIFLQKGTGQITGTTSNALPISSPGNSGIMPPTMQVPKTTSRAVILRRGNSSRPGNVMIVDMHKNQLVSSGQVPPQLLQTARLITGPSDIGLLNNPSIIASTSLNTSTLTTAGRKLLPSPGIATSTPVLSYAPRSSATPLEAYLSKQFLSVQHQSPQFSPAKGIQLLTSQPSTTLTYVTTTRLPSAVSTLRPSLGQIQTLQSTQSIPTSIYLPGKNKGMETPTNTAVRLVEFGKDVVQGEELNASKDLDNVMSSAGINDDSENHKDPHRTINNGNSTLNSSSRSNSSATDTASEGESFSSPIKLNAMTMASSLPVGIDATDSANHEINENVNIGQNPVDIFQTALQSSGIDLSSVEEDAEESYEDFTPPSPTTSSLAKGEPLHSTTTQCISTVDSSELSK